MPAAQNDDSPDKINQEIYKQNFELSIRNKTLSTLRALYAITTSSTDITESAQKIVDTIKEIDQGTRALDNSRWRLLEERYR